MSNSITEQFARLSTEADEARIRLYGVLCLLVEDGIISRGRAMEIGCMPYTTMLATLEDRLANPPQESG